MDSLLAAILADDLALVNKLLVKEPGLASQGVETATFYDKAIFHWLYVGDTALHLAAAGYRVKIAQQLLAAGANPNSAANHRRGTPLHYAADGYIIGPAWNAIDQVAMLRCLIEAGAAIDFQDKNGATPLHRAVRTRCAAAVKYLLESGCDPMIKNKPGSTPFHLAVQNTGRGGSGSAAAIAAQRAIINEFRARDISTATKDGRGNSVLQCAERGKVSEWLR